MSESHDHFLWHEALDRASIVLGMLHDYVTEHPIVKSDPELLQLAEGAEEVLHDFYSAICKKAPHFRDALTPHTTEQSEGE